MILPVQPPLDPHEPMEAGWSSFHPWLLNRIKTRSKDHHQPSIKDNGYRASYPFYSNRKQIHIKYSKLQSFESVVQIYINKKEKKRESHLCDNHKIEGPMEAPALLGVFCLLTDKSNQRLVNSATRQDKIFVTFGMSRCSSDRASSVLGCFCCRDVSPAIIFKEHTFCNQGLF